MRGREVVGMRGLEHELRGVKLQTGAGVWG